MENKAHQQHAMLEEEKLMEAQHEALALQQQVSDNYLKRYIFVKVDS